MGQVLLRDLEKSWKTGLHLLSTRYINSHNWESNPVLLPSPHLTYSVQFSSIAQSCPTLCDPMDCSTLGAILSITNSRSLLKLMSIESVIPSNHLIPYHPLLLLPSLFPYTTLFRSCNQSILKEISPEYSLEGLMLKLKLQYFGHLMRRTDSLEKNLMLGKIEGRRRSGCLPEPTQTLDHRIIDTMIKSLCRLR